MNREENVKKSFDAIMALKGADEFKAKIQNLHNFLKNKDAHVSFADVTLPNYLWIAKRGGGVTTLLNAFAEYLYATNAIAFCGLERFLEFKLDYISPDAPFSELTRFDRTIAARTGHNRYYRGVVCVNIDDWQNTADEDHFMKFVNFVASNRDKWLTILYINTEKKDVVESIEVALAMYMNFKTIKLRFPDEHELMELVENRLLKNSIKLDENAKALLRETIKEISKGKHFNGFKTIKQLTEEIRYKILTENSGKKQIITAKMLADFDKDSDYVKRRKAQIGNRKSIGFAGAGGYENEPR